MTTMLRRSAAVAVCAIIAGWSAPLANGSEASASGPAAPITSPPTNATSYAPVPDNFSLTVSPTRIVVKQADHAAVPKLLVVNRGQAPVSVVVQKRNFTGRPDGTLNFQDNAPYAASEWVTVEPASFTVAPGTSQTVTAAITIAASPEPGDHQVAIVFLVPTGESTANVKINRGVAVPVYITVSGPTDDSASFSGIGAPGFVTGGTVDVTATVRNDGTVHRDFRSATSLTMDVGGTAAPFPDFTVMRDSTRDIATTWDPPLMCICHPTVSIVNADGSVRTATVRVVVFPLHLLGIAVGVFLVLAFGLWLRRRRRQARVLNTAPTTTPAGGVSHA